MGGSSPFPQWKCQRGTDTRALMRLRRQCTCFIAHRGDPAHWARQKMASPRGCALGVCSCVDVVAIVGDCSPFGTGDFAKRRPPEAFGKACPPEYNNRGVVRVDCL